jgi:hypothetical protein
MVQQKILYGQQGSYTEEVSLQDLTKIIRYGIIIKNIEQEKKLKKTTHFCCRWNRLNLSPVTLIKAKVPGLVRYLKYL